MLVHFSYHCKLLLRSIFGVSIDCVPRPGEDQHLAHVYLEDRGHLVSDKREMQHHAQDHLSLD